MYKSILFFGRKWLWPEHDTKLLQVNDWVRDVDIALNYCQAFRTVVQAGGACGIWPSYLSSRFETVITFEPDPINFRCLTRNTRDETNVIAFQAALGDKCSAIALENPPSEDGNAGTWYVKPGKHGVIPMLPLDTVTACQEVDLICLDVEGLETQVLKGARQTIENCLPIIMLEDKILPQNDELGTFKGEAVEWLRKEYNYRIVQEVHRDIILEPPTRATANQRSPLKLVG